MMDAKTLEFFKQFSDAVPHSKALGVRTVEIGAARVTLAMQPQPFMVGDPERGMLFTAVTYSLIDSACGAAVFSALENYRAIATLDLRKDDFAPALLDGGELFCEARCPRLTADVAFVEAEVWQFRRESPLAAGRGVFALGTPVGNAQLVPGERNSNSRAAT